MVEELVRSMVRHLVTYALPEDERAVGGHPEATENFLAAREELRTYLLNADGGTTTGEAGEILLYLLIELLLDAPQLVSKIGLKPNNRTEVPGVDGIHARFDDTADRLEIYMGEAKIHANVRTAIKEAIKRVAELEPSRAKNELRIATKNFKFADAVLKAHLATYIKRGTTNPKTRINHAVLIGFDFARYKAEAANDFATIREDMRKAYVDSVPHLVTTFEKHAKDVQMPELRFQLFFLPFPSVDDMREMFRKAL
ncbi:MAG: DUF1837 domain-containing protein [Candidatus Thermoplasmatota archaeon]